MMQDRREDKLENLARGLSSAAPAAPAEKKTASQRRPKLKKECWGEYEPTAVVITPSLAKNFKTDQHLNINAGSTTEAVDRKGAKLRHSTTFKLNHSTVREQKEEKFQISLYNGILQAAEELEI